MIKAGKGEKTEKGKRNTERDRKKGGWKGENRGERLENRES